MHRFRAWMNKERFVSNSLLTTEYATGLTEFMTLAGDQESCLTSGMMFCPCLVCNNIAFIDKGLVWSHLYRNKILPSY
ncbi:Transposase-associated domain, partial [Arabidopsis suecica]